MQLYCPSLPDLGLTKLAYLLTLSTKSLPLLSQYLIDFLCLLPWILTPDLRPGFRLEDLQCTLSPLRNLRRLLKVVLLTLLLFVGSWLDCRRARLGGRWIGVSTFLPLRCFRWLFKASLFTLLSRSPFGSGGTLQSGRWLGWSFRDKLWCGRSFRCTLCWVDRNGLESSEWVNESLGH